MSYRRQKRWWNAYILFYERQDVADTNKKLVDESKCAEQAFQLLFNTFDLFKSLADLSMDLMTVDPAVWTIQRYNHKHIPLEQGYRSDDIEL